MVDSELRGIDALLSDNNEHRFAARRVAGIDHPERLSKYIRTDSWHPINATIQISDMPSIIKSIGGEELYGAFPTVPLRELIQNASDAIRARRAYEGHGVEFGGIEVEIKNHEDQYWLNISDNGTGMSEAVLTNYLLDFGKSFWRSNYVQEEFPGLASSDFQATGKYGIGFFSVFMIAEKVKITTRHVDSAKKDTSVLEFGCGLLERPTLRPATPEEYIRDGGTTISIKLTNNPYEENGFLYSEKDSIDEKISLSTICLNIAPAIDVKLTSIENGKKEHLISANDWKEISDSEFVERLANQTKSRYLRSTSRELDRKVSKAIRYIYDDNNNITGRACITAISKDFIPLVGLLTVGGLESNTLHGISGIIQSRALRASRDSAEPIASHLKISEWATEQADLVKEIYSDPEALNRCASVIAVCGGNTKDLPIARFNGSWISIKDINKNKTIDELTITEPYVYDGAIKNLKNINLSKDVLAFDRRSYMAISGSRNFFIRTKEPGYFDINSERLSKNIIAAIADSWGVDKEKLQADFMKAEDKQVVIGNSEFGEIKCFAITINKNNYTPI